MDLFVYNHKQNPESFFLPIEPDSLMIQMIFLETCLLIKYWQKTKQIG